MLTKPRRSKRAAILAAPLLAAPLVVTAVFTPACGRTYTNPRPPQDPDVTPTATVPPDDTAAPTSTPVASDVPVATAAPRATPSTAPDADLPPAPKGGSGHVERMPDGSCLYIYPEPTMHCPPGAHCNPGPPRDPLKVKCPSGNDP